MPFVLRAVSGTLTTVRGLPADTTTYHGVATGLRGVWLAVHEAIGDVVDGTSLADLLGSARSTGARPAAGRAERTDPLTVPRQQLQPPISTQEMA